MRDCPSSGERYGRGRQDGSMTVFFCLILMLVSAVICTCLESARTAGLRFMAGTAADSSLQSVFADYHRKLWEDYHVFFHYEQRDMADEVEEQLEYYVNPSKGLNGLPEYTDLWGLSVNGAAVTERKTALSDGGRLFLEQAVKYEKYQIAEDILERFFDRADILDEVEKIRSFAARLSEGFDVIREVSTYYQDVRDGVAAVLSLGEELREMVSGEYPDMETLRLRLAELAEGERNLLRRAESYLRRAENIEGLADELAEEYGDSGDTVYGQQIRQLTSLTAKGLLGGAVISAGACAEAVLEKTSELLDGISRLKEEEESMGAEELRDRLDALYETAEESMDGCVLLLREMGDQMDAAADSSRDTGNDADGGSENGDGDEGGAGEESRAGEDGNSLLELVRQWKNMAVLSLAMGEAAQETRDDRVSMPEMLPSAVVRETLTEVSPVEKGLFVFYIADTFTSQLSAEQGVFACQQEYILFGKRDSRSNLTAMAELLLAVREGLNLAFLLTSEKMRTAAKTAAYALVGASGLYPLVPVTEFLILAAWAFAEAVDDLRRLFDGERVALWKTEASWKTSLSGLADPGSGAAVQGKAPEVELSYGDYLKLFLFVRNTGTLCLRSMDVIQQETGAEQEGFLMADCCGAAKVTVDFSSPFRLITLPLIGESPGNGHRICTVSSYWYD